MPNPSGTSAAGGTASIPAFKPVLDIKKDFPVLNRQFGGMPLHYLDSAATTQKPLAVIEAMNTFYMESYGTVRRGVYRLSEKATEAYEGTRKKIAALINAASEREIIYTSGTTQSINLVAYSYGRKFLKAGDEIILSQIEHHANIVPWQLIGEMTGAVIKVIPVDDTGTLILEEYKKLLSERTRIVAVNHISNALGTINPVKEIIRLAHAVPGGTGAGPGGRGAVVLVDGAQSIAHMAVDVRDLDADFYAFSGHKMFGPTGVGILYGKLALLESMPPYQGGGDMIMKVTFEKTTYQSPPHRFEAGTPPIVEVLGLGAAVDYLKKTGLDRIAAHEHALLEYGTAVLKEVPGLRLIGTAAEKGSILSFTLEGVHPHDIGTLLDEDGIAIRAGHHCAQPTMDRFGVPATARASIGPYNDASDLDALAKGLKRIGEMFR
ncbi:MAG: cysteine desulfurase, SufS subfamily [Fibrobacteres bacterium]|nr:cysteine desulfurase, SufS subfamily [Fibrobacterota bacterium]